MLTPPRCSARRIGFTLIEMLVVVGIVATLIGILVPSLARAKDLAKKAKTVTELASISTNLELFQTEFRQYPESNATRVDPIIDWPGATNPDTPIMQGAHWLARALAGPDGEGVDSSGLVLKDRQYVRVDATSGQLVSADSGGPGGTVAALQKTSRKSRYLGSTRLLAQDSDPSRFEKPFVADLTRKGRFILADAFDGPILYYRATAKAGFPFTTNDDGTGPTAGPGVYNLLDNAAITGCDRTNTPPWDFANTGLRHGLGYFGPDRSQILANPGSVHTTIPPVGSGYRGRSFCDSLHDEQAYDTGGTIKPVNAEGFLLISAGKDAVFGTDDDITNFNRR